MDDKLNVIQKESSFLETHVLKNEKIETQTQLQNVKLDKFGFEEENIKKRAEQRTFSNKKIDIERIEKDEMEHLIGKNAPLPEFDVLTPAEEKSLKKHSRRKFKRYIAQKDAYIQKLNAWGENEGQRKLAYREVIRLRRKGERYPDIEADAESMLEAYNWAEKAENKAEITNFGIEQTKALMELAKRSGCKHAKDGLKEYVGDYYQALNEYLRKDRKLDNVSAGNRSILSNKCIRNFEHAEDAIKMQKMSHQLVTHRYVAADALKFMFGGNSIQEAETLLDNYIKKEKKEEKLFVEEKGFSSTGMYSTPMNEGFRNQVEIFILVEKGTHAVSIAKVKEIEKYDEAELLLGPGTKFEVVDVRKNNEFNNAFKDVKWRLFLKTIPQKGDGVPA